MMLLRLALGLGILLPAACGIAPSPAERRPSFAPGRPAVTCGGDPSCRLLTPGEIALAAGIFGDRIDYAAIRIFDDAGDILGHFTDSTTLGNDIRIHARSRYLRDYNQAPPVQRSLFLHEMTHVWQYQSGENFVWDRLRDFARHGFDRQAVYAYTLTLPRLSDYSTEQQAHIVATYHVRVSDAAEAGDAAARRALCESIRAHEAVLATALPLRRSPLCAEP